MIQYILPIYIFSFHYKKIELFFYFSRFLSATKEYLVKVSNLCYCPKKGGTAHFGKP